MHVFELIEILKQAPPTLEVMLDVSVQSGNKFLYASVADADVITDSNDDTYFMLSPYEPNFEESNEN